MKYLVLDCETLGLDPVKHAVWEIAWKLIDPKTFQVLACDDLQIDLTDEQIAAADPYVMDPANSVGGFTERWMGHGCPTVQPENAAKRLANILETPLEGWELEPGIFHSELPENEQIILLGSNPSFDDRRVGDLLRAHGCKPPWHYHLEDIGGLGRGWLMAKTGVVPALRSSDNWSRAVGVEPDDFDRHTAMGDVDWTIAQLRAITPGTP